MVKFLRLRFFFLLLIALDRIEIKNKDGVADIANTINRTG